MANTKKTGPQDKVTSKKPAATKKTAAVETSPKKAPKADKPLESKEKKKGAPAPKRFPLVEKTFFAKKGGVSQWKVVDASGQTLGRLASQVAVLLMGKHYPHFTPNNDTGDSVIVINADKVVLTGDKWNQKLYQHHSNFPGGLKTITAKRLLETHPERIVEKAVWRMMPKSRGHMARHWFAKLHVYTGSEHPHAAQKPVPFNLVHSTQGRS